MANVWRFLLTALSTYLYRIKDNNDFYNKYKDIALSEKLAIAFSETQEEITKKNRS